MRILGDFWFSQLENPYPIGIIYGHDEITHEPKAYIGRAFGLNHRKDIEHVLTYGSPFDLHTARILFKHLHNETPEENAGAVDIISDLLRVIYAYQRHYLGQDDIAMSETQKAKAWLEKHK